MVPNLFLGHLQPFLVEPYFDQVQNKGFALLAAGQFETRLQEFGLWTSLARWELTSQALYYNLPYLFTDVTTIICYSFLNQSFLNPELTVFQKTILNLKFKIPAHNSTMITSASFKDQYQSVQISCTRQYVKVQILWEGYKIWNNIHFLLLSSNIKTSWEIFSNLCGLLRTFEL